MTPGVPEAVAPGIVRVPPQEEPLSADVFIVAGREGSYVYDVGSSEAALRALRALDGPVTVVLSHFHRDHTANLAALSPDEVLVGARTRRQLGRGTLVDGERLLDGGRIRVLPCVSPHAPGCLIMVVDDTCALVGDLCYARPGEGQGEARGMLRVLRKLPVRWIIQSHGREVRLQERDELIRELRAYYGL